MPIDVTTLPSTWTDPNTGNTYGVYSSPQEYAESYDPNPGVIPDDNMDSALWTDKAVGGWSSVAVPAPGARAPGAKIGVLGAYHPTTDRYDVGSYERAFENVMGERPAPGAFPVIIVWAVVALIIALVAIWAVYSLLIYAVNKDTEVTMEPVVGEDGEESEWVLVCKGGTCQFFNRATGETTEGPSNDSVLSKFLTPLVVVAVVGVGAYAAIKVFGAMGKPRRI
ncbi:MAG: hypothetical protein M0R06_25760 [Sphaerochaeta sp.]|jgi:hypothetical protein|nr:hypothetical protein [Sphaerochaeta sp.]